MKIVQILPYAMDRPGGAQNNARDLSQWLRTQGHEVKIVAPPGQVAVQDPNQLTIGHARNITVHGTTFEISYVSPATCRQTCETLLDWGAEVLHLHTPWTPLMPWQLWRALKLPAIATFHATLPEGGFDPLSWALRKVGHHFNRHLSHITVPSEGARKQWIAAKADPVPTAVPPSVDLSQWRAAALITQKPSHFRVAYMGRLEHRKGVATLLEAWRAVQAAEPEAELIIAGQGEEDASLRQLAADHGLSSVSFRPPPSYTEAPALFASAHVFAAPALYGESFGIVLTEAMAAGAVPVAAANAGFATVMAGGGEDLLCPPGDARALAERLLHLSRDRTYYDSRRDWAVAQAHRFDIATLGPTYEALLFKAATEFKSNGQKSPG